MAAASKNIAPTSSPRPEERTPIQPIENPNRYALGMPQTSLARENRSRRASSRPVRRSDTAGPHLLLQAPWLRPTHTITAVSKTSLNPHFCASVLDTRPRHGAATTT